MRSIRLLAVCAGMLFMPLGLASDPARAASGPARVGQVAPEITGGPWINSEPLSLGGLRGRVVLVEFWTFG